MESYKDYFLKTILGVVIFSIFILLWNIGVNLFTFYVGLSGDAILLIQTFVIVIVAFLWFSYMFGDSIFKIMRAYKEEK